MNAAAARTMPVSSMPALEIEDVTVRFGGLTAVSHVSLRAVPGTITGLIGPNGAGKTTTFNACTGVVRTTSGRVTLGRRSLEKLSTPTRAAAGLGRTFQRMELFDSMSVTENVAMGPEGVLSSRKPWGQFFAPPSERREVAERTREALHRCGLEGFAARRVRDLSTGQRRLVELARAIASPFTFLLLDEPSSGLDVHETEEFGRVLAQHVADTGMGVLLVEHDMALVADVCTQINVLDFGRLIWSGPTAEALTSDLVRAAYLGGDVDAGLENLEVSDA
jgi:ABC-type branched-subunit amino acid transport system ATPase component